MRLSLRSVARTILQYARRLRRRIRPANVAVLTPGQPVRLHLGCGEVRLPGWINIDGNPASAADVVMDFRQIGGAFPASSVDEMMMIHSLSYLRLWEARDLLAAAHGLLKPGGKFIAEFPDVAKCAVVLCGPGRVVDSHLEGVRALYAFDLGQIARRDLYTPYAFGWAAWHLEHELRAAGFRAIRTLPPLTHGQLTWRDSRVEAAK